MAEPGAEEVPELLGGYELPAEATTHVQPEENNAEQQEANGDHQNGAAEHSVEPQGDSLQEPAPQQAEQQQQESAAAAADTSAPEPPAAEDAGRRKRSRFGAPVAETASAPETAPAAAEGEEGDDGKKRKRRSRWEKEDTAIVPVTSGGAVIVPGAFPKELVLPGGIRVRHAAPTTAGT